MNRTRALSVLGALLFASSVAYARAVTPFPAPIVSASTLTLSPDSLGVVARWVRRCVGTQCPTQYEVDVQRKSAAGWTAEAHRIVSAFKDTARVMQSVCLDGSRTDTLIVSVRALANGNATASAYARAFVPSRCRPATAVERKEAAAFADSFPDAGNRLVMTDESTILVGEARTFCWLARNRYTGAVVLVAGPADECESARLRMQSERAG